MESTKTNKGLAEVLKAVESFLSICLLSTILAMVVLLMTAVPSDLTLLKVLLNDPLIGIMNTLPIMAVMSLLYCLTNRMGFSFGMTGWICFAICEVNRFKIVFRDDPFVFSDILLVNEAKDMMGKYELYIDKVTVLAVVLIILGTMFAGIMMKVKLEYKRTRLIYAMIVIIISLVGCKSLYFKNSDIYYEMWHYQFGNQWKSGNQYMARGTIYSFVRSIQDAIIVKPDGYNKSIVTAKLDEYEDVMVDKDKQANVISIMLEAYNDFSDFNEVELVADPYVAFHELQEDSYHGKLFTNIFAAGTIQTERSFLTGYSDSTYKERNVTSYVRYFNDLGYYTEAMHPCYGWFYNRRNIEIYLGFDNFLYYENAFADVDESELEEETYHGLLSDYDFFDYIIQGYEDAASQNQKYFNFSVTYQNRGPYETESDTDETYLFRKDEYTDNEYNILNNYLYHVSKTDKAIAKLRAYIDEQEEPIILVLFGDHNPWLGDNNSVYEMLGINLDLDTEEGAENYYETRYIVYANEAAKEMYGKSFTEEGNTISPMFLMNEIFDYLGLEGPAYLNYLDDLKSQYNILNTVYTGNIGNLQLTADLTDDEAIKEQKQIEYYLKYVKK